MSKKELLAKLRPQVEVAMMTAGKQLADYSRSIDGLLRALRVVDEGLTLLNRIDQEFSYCCPEGPTHEAPQESLSRTNAPSRLGRLPESGPDLPRKE